MTELGKKHLSFGLAFILSSNCHGICKTCNSRGCFMSNNFQPVSKWKCYPKNMENKI